MADREKLIELLDEAEEHSTDICVYNSDCKDCPGRKYGNKCREYLKADHLIANGVTVRERGRWVVDDADSGEPGGYEAFIEAHCPKCRYDIGIAAGEYGWAYGDPFPMNFCPNCGADMR